MYHFVFYLLMATGQWSAEVVPASSLLACERAQIPYVQAAIVEGGGRILTQCAPGAEPAFPIHIPSDS